MKKIFITIILGLSIFFFTENTFSSNVKNNCNQETDMFCVEGKVTEETKGISGGKEFDKLILSGVEYIIGFILFISVIYGLYGAWNILSSMNDDEKVKKGKTIIIRACIGIVVIFSAYMITDFVINKLMFQEKTTNSKSP